VILMRQQDQRFVAGYWKFGRIGVGASAACTIPLFMAGDKQYYYYLNRLAKPE
jgi:hypothetical protein